MLSGPAEAAVADRCIVPLSRWLSRPSRVVRLPRTCNFPCSSTVPVPASAFPTRGSRRVPWFTASRGSPQGRASWASLIYSHRLVAWGTTPWLARLRFQLPSCLADWGTTRRRRSASLAFSCRRPGSLAGVVLLPLGIGSPILRPSAASALGASRRGSGSVARWGRKCSERGSEVWRSGVESVVKWVESVAKWGRKCSEM